MQHGLSGWHWSIRAFSLGHLAYSGVLVSPIPFPHTLQSFMGSSIRLNAPTCSRLPFGRLLWTMALISHPSCPSTPLHLPCLPGYLWGQLGVQGQELIQNPGACVSLLPPPLSWKSQKPAQVLSASCPLPRVPSPLHPSELLGEGKMGPRPLWPLTLRGVLPEGFLGALSPPLSLLSAGWRMAVGMRLLRSRCLPCLLFFPLPGPASSLCPSCLHAQRVLDL